jgi:5'-nucleotidase
VRRTGLVVLAAALSLPLALQGGQRPSAGRGTVTVQLLAINDFHGHLEPPSGSNGQINAVAAGGAEYLATHLENAVRENPNSIVVAAGDLVGASPLLSALFRDEPAIEALSAMDLAVAAVGNHEFDEGFRELLRLKRGGCHPADGCRDGDGFAGAAFEYLSANVVRSASRAPLFPATAIRTIGGVKVGFIGQTLRGTARIIPPAGSRGLTFLDEASTANAHAARLKRQGVHAIVLLIHQGGRQVAGERPADPNGCTGFTGGIEPILARLTPDIQVVVSGHTHEFYNCRIGTRLVTAAGSYGRMLTRVNLEIQPSTGRLARATATNRIVTRDVARDPAQTAIIAKYAALVEDTASTVVGSVTADLLRAPNGAGESALGNVIADAQLAAASARAGGAVVAFMNKGGIRADIVAAPPRAAARPGEVTYRDLHTVQPFGNALTVLTMTGDMIRRALEQQFDNPGPGVNQILQVSSGFTYRYRAAAPAGRRVDAGSIQIDGRAVGPADRVRVAASDFLAAGGDAFSAFAEGTNRVVLTTDIDALVEYFKARSPVSPPPLNRIVRVD